MYKQFGLLLYMVVTCTGVQFVFTYSLEVSSVYIHSRTPHMTVYMIYNTLYVGLTMELYSHSTQLCDSN